LSKIINFSRIPTPLTNFTKPHKTPASSTLMEGRARPFLVQPRIKITR